MSELGGAIVAGIVAFIFVVLIIIGWILNVVSFFTMSWEVITGEFIVRLVGIPVPFIGGIMGWF